AVFESFTIREGDFPYGFGLELDRLLAVTIRYPELDLATYSELYSTTDELLLPMLPAIPASQVFRIQPTLVDFEGGRGVRYLTYYTQAPSPITDRDIFYTFQGVTDDGAYYISAI